MADIAGMTAATDVLRFGDLDVEVRDLIAELIGELAEAEAAAATATARRDAVRLEIIRRRSTP